MFDGGYASKAEHIQRALDRRDLAWTDIDAVLVSHGHADHTGGVQWIAQQSGAPVVVGQGDADLVATGTNGEVCPTSWLARRREKKDVGLTYEPLEPDVFVPVNSGVPLSDLLSDPRLPGEVVAEAGHTEGSLIYVVGGVAFVGDLFRGSILGHKATRHFYMCDLDDNAEDVRTLLQADAPNAQVFFPGHFGPVSRDAVKAMLDDWQDTP